MNWTSSLSEGAQSLSGSGVGSGGVGRNCGYGRDGEREGSAGHPGQTKLSTTNVGNVCPLGLQHSGKRLVPPLQSFLRAHQAGGNCAAILAHLTNLKKICLQVCEEHFKWLPTLSSCGYYNQRWELKKKVDFSGICT